MSPVSYKVSDKQWKYRLLVRVRVRIIGCIGSIRELREEQYELANINTKNNEDHTNTVSQSPKCFTAKLM